VHEQQAGHHHDRVGWPTGRPVSASWTKIINGSAIKPSGGNNVSELNDPAINKR